MHNKTMNPTNSAISFSEGRPGATPNGTPRKAVRKKDDAARRGKTFGARFSGEEHLIIEKAIALVDPKVSDRQFILSICQRVINETNASPTLGGPAIIELLGRFRESTVSELSALQSQLVSMSSMMTGMASGIRSMSTDIREMNRKFDAATSMNGERAKVIAELAAKTKSLTQTIEAGHVADQARQVAPVAVPASRIAHPLLRGQSKP